MYECMYEFHEYIHYMDACMYVCLKLIMYIFITHMYVCIVFFVNGISTFVGYLMPKLFS